MSKRFAVRSKRIMARKAHHDQQIPQEESTRNREHRPEHIPQMKADIAMLQNGQSTPQSIMRLQKAIGNKATIQLMRDARNQGGQVVRGRGQGGHSIQRNKVSSYPSGYASQVSKTPLADTLATYGNYWKRAWTELVTGKSIKNTGIIIREWKSRHDHYTAAAKHLAAGWKLEKKLNKAKNVKGWQSYNDAKSEFASARTHYRRINYLLKRGPTELTIDIPWLILSGDMIKLPAVITFASLPGKIKRLARRYQKSAIAKAMVFEGFEHEAETMKFNVDFFAIRKIVEEYKKNRRGYVSPSKLSPRHRR